MTALDMTPVPVEEQVALLRKAVEWVESQASLPEIDREWNQNYYHLGNEGRARMLLGDRLDSFDALSRWVPVVASRCGSAYCVAGYLGALLEPAFEHTELVYDVDQGDDVHVSAFVREKLGMAGHEADELFNGSNTATDVRTIAETIAGQRL